MYVYIIKIYYKGDRMKNIIEELNKMTKTEIIDIIADILDNEKIDKSMFEKRLTAEDYTPEEQLIVDKLQTQQCITQNELNYIKERLNKRANTKIKTILLSGGKKFDAFIVKAKLDQYFSICWSHYPRKIGKAEGEKAFNKLVSEQKLSLLSQYCEFVLKRIDKYVEYCQNNDTEEQFIMHFSTFCNSKRYL